MPEDRPDLRVQAVWSDQGREDRTERDEHEDRRPDHRRGPVAERSQHDPAPGRRYLERRLDQQRDVAHAVILGSSLK